MQEGGSIATAREDVIHVIERPSKTAKLNESIMEKGEKKNSTDCNEFCPRHEMCLVYNVKFGSEAVT